MWIMILFIGLKGEDARAEERNVLWYFPTGTIL